MEKKGAQIIVDEIHLIKVEVVQQRLDVANYKKQKKHQFKVGHKLLHSLKEDRVKLEFVFSFLDDQNQETLFFQIDFHFHIENLNNFYELKEENHPVFNGYFISTLIGICFSTARGIIFEKLNNAGIQNVLLPVVSPQDMLVKPSSE